MQGLHPGNSLLIEPVSGRATKIDDYSRMNTDSKLACVSINAKPKSKPIQQASIWLLNIFG